MRIRGQRRRIEAPEAQRRQILGVDVGIGLEVGLHVPRVDPDQHDRHDPLQPDRLERQERGTDRDRVGDHEVADVVAEDLGVDRHHVAAPAGGVAWSQDRAPVTNIASVESMNGAPRIAPDADASRRLEPPPVRIAMIGIIVSGSAVPTAARTEPTAPSASSSFRPNHSMPFVNSSAPSRMIDERDGEDQDVHRGGSGLRAAQDDAQRDHDEDQRGDDRHRPLATDDESAERDDDAA